VTDPVTNRRLNVYADDAASLEHRCNRVRGIRDDLKAGIITREQASQLTRPLHSGPLTVEAAFNRFLATQSEASAKIARANWKSRLAKWFGKMSPVDLTREKMAAWEADLIKRGDASATIKNTYDNLSAACRLLVDSRELECLPWGDVSRHLGGTGWRPRKVVAKKQRRALATPAQLMAFLNVARADDLKYWKRGIYSDRSTVLTILFLVGLRQAEACALSWDMFTIDGDEPHLLRVAYQAKSGWQKTGAPRPRQETKTRTERTHHLHQSVVKVLRWHRAELARRGWYRPDGPVFPGKAGRFRTSGVVIKPERVRQYAKAAGFPMWADWVTHSTRHSFATLEAIAAGGDLRRAQLRTGHADLRVLEGYIHDAGQFLGQTALPAIDVSPPAMGLLPDGSGEMVAADPWGIEQVPAAPAIDLIDLSAANAVARRRRAEKRAFRERVDSVNFADLAREWIDSGGFGKSRSGLPPEVIARGDRTATRHYQRAKRAGKSPLECAKAARHGRIAVQAAWTKAMRKALRLNPPKPAPVEP